MLLVIATVLLALTPVTIHASIALVEAIVLVVGLLVMLTANLLLLRPTLGPVDRLVDRMRTVDLLRPGQRFVERGGIEVGQLEARRIARELRPEMLEHFGLVSALRELARKFADQGGIGVEHRFADDLPPLSEEAEIAVTASPRRA